MQASIQGIRRTDRPDRRFSVLDAAPAQAAKLHFGTQEYLRQIQDVEVKGPKGEALYLGHKYSFHSFILPYRMTDDGYVLGVRGEQSYFRLNDANIKSMQAAASCRHLCRLINCPSWTTRWGMAPGSRLPSSSA